MDAPGGLFLQRSSTLTLLAASRCFKCSKALVLPCSFEIASNRSSKGHLSWSRPVECVRRHSNIAAPPGTRAKYCFDESPPRLVNNIQRVLRRKFLSFPPLIAIRNFPPAASLSPTPPTPPAATLPFSIPISIIRMRSCPKVLRKRPPLTEASLQLGQLRSHSAK